MPVFSELLQLDFEFISIGIKSWTDVEYFDRDDDVVLAMNCCSEGMRGEVKGGGNTTQLPVGNLFENGGGVMLS